MQTTSYPNNTAAAEVYDVIDSHDAQMLLKGNCKVRMEVSFQTCMVLEQGNRQCRRTDSCKRTAAFYLQRGFSGEILQASVLQ